VTLVCPPTTKECADLPAQVDTAADRTVVPWRAVEQLGLEPMGEMQVQSFGGEIATFPAFLVQLQVREQEPMKIKVLSSQDEPYVLLGRDALNRLRLLLDGPALLLDIG
jgi:predicted aspartyl protease